MIEESYLNYWKELVERCDDAAFANEFPTLLEQIGGYKGLYQMVIEAIEREKGFYLKLF